MSVSPHTNAVRHLPPLRLSIVRREGKVSTVRVALHSSSVIFAPAIEMSSLSTKSRKRLRTESNENGVAAQSKYFINQQIIDRRDSDKMKQIYSECT